MARFLDAYVEAYDPADSARLLEAIRRDLPGASPEDVALEVVTRRFRAAGMPLSPLTPALAERMRRMRVVALDRPRLSALLVQLDVLQDVAALHANHSSPTERQLELLAVLALGLGDLELGRELHKAHLRSLRRTVDPARLAGRVERALEDARRLPRLVDGHPVGLGLALLDAHTLAGLGAVYFERTVIEEEAVERLHHLSREQKRSLLLMLLALAWADGELHERERYMIEELLALAGLSAADQRALAAHLERPLALEDVELAPLDAGTRRLFLEQGILLTHIDDHQDEGEVLALESAAERLGGSSTELEALQLEVYAFYRRHRQALLELGVVPGLMGRLQQVLVARAQQVVIDNLGRIVQELRETGELTRLLAAASVRDLSKEEQVKVKEQLFDLCKTVPALAIFLLPGGGLLLPVLIRLLPFNILPSSFASSDPELDLAVGGAGGGAVGGAVALPPGQAPPSPPPGPPGGDPPEGDPAAME